MYHIVYLTTNLVNQKFYVGVHSTYNLDDGYLGSGDILKLAVRKYDKKNFIRKTLYFCLTRIDALDIERLIVNKDFVKRSDTYNLVVGGNSYNTDYNPFQDKLHSYESRLKMSISSYTKNKPAWNKGKFHSDETKLKLSISMKGRLPWNKGLSLPKHSEEYKKNMSEIIKNKQKLLCAYCNTYIDSGNFKQYHGIHCKLNPNYDISSKRVMTDIERDNIRKGRLLQKRVKCPYCDIDITIQNLDRHIKSKHIS